MSELPLIQHVFVLPLMQATSKADYELTSAPRYYSKRPSTDSPVHIAAHISHIEKLSLITHNVIFLRRRSGSRRTQSDFAKCFSRERHRNNTDPQMAYTDKADRHADTYAQPALLRAFPNDEEVGQGQIFISAKRKIRFVMTDRLELQNRKEPTENRASMIHNPKQEQKCESEDMIVWRG